MSGDGADDGAPPAGTGAVEVAGEVACAEPVDADRWSALLADVLAAEGVAAGAQVGLTFVGAEAMAELNATHMGAEGPTDVLAFPVDGREAAGAGDAGPPGLVGDLVVCPRVAATNAPDHAGTEDDELALLVVHGALHLVGHDHAEADERARMQARERTLLADLHGPLAADPWAVVG
ncbi:rRNA maturation RNase YbeY [Iamia majanohamensis]|uniref:Endoribonuclease YbeY n=1 Tax=Iamia majanohamensis TaxID=467976 RepID=A0AAE9Y3V3_9ACTN|nr:rRNA maturation RNase YbeY [Iamia majanohamensis]WCO65592.1 rRNA maturation RNase YbeY [Iamia majanohamensis]